MMNTKNIKVSKKFIMTLILIGIMFYFLISVQLGPPKRSSDSIRTSDLVKIKTALNLYATDNKTLYPPVSSICNDIGILSKYLTPRYLDSIPSDPKIANNHPNYRIAVNPERTYYVIKALLDTGKASTSTHDLDGTVMGCSCDDPNYCIDSL